MTPAENTVARLKAEAKLRARGHSYEDFSVGQRFVHHWGRTVTESDSVLFSTLTLHYNPHYTNADFAAAHGHRAMPINPLLVFNTVFGLSVEDLSEIGGPFLGVEELSYLRDVYPGETLYATHTQGRNQRGEAVITFKRANLVRTRS